MAVLTVKRVTGEPGRLPAPRATSATGYTMCELRAPGSDALLRPIGLHLKLG